MPWWGWLLIGLSLLAVLAAIAVTFRSQLSFAVKFARTLMSDPRVPRPLRWLIGVCLAIKVIPFPDFGVDEIILVVVGLVLLVFYRPVLQAILDETRSAEAARLGSPLGAAPELDDPGSD